MKTFREILEDIENVKNYNKENENNLANAKLQSFNKDKLNVITIDWINNTFKSLLKEVGKIIGSRGLKLLIISINEIQINHKFEFEKIDYYVNTFKDVLLNNKKQILTQRVDTLDKELLKNVQNSLGFENNDFEDEFEWVSNEFLKILAFACCVSSLLIVKTITEILKEF